MRRFLSVVAGVFGLWLFAAGSMSVLGTAPGSFLPAMWTELLLGAVILTGSALLWRVRAHHGAAQPAAAAADRPRAAPAAERQGR